MSVVHGDNSLPVPSVSSLPGTVQLDPLDKSIAQVVGDIVVLLGTSTAGKTSISNALQRLEPDRVIREVDLMRDPQLPCTDRLFEQLFDETMEATRAGGATTMSLIFPEQADDLEKFLLQNNVQATVRKILVFCPMHVLDTRIVERNDEGGSNQRNPLMPFDAFANLYEAIEEGGLETITRDDAVDVYSRKFDAMIAFARAKKNLLPSEDEIAIDKVESLQKFLEKLGFTDETVGCVNLAPRRRDAYDAVVSNINLTDAEDIAKMLYEERLQRY